MTGNEWEKKGFESAHHSLDIWRYSMAGKGIMRQALRHSSQWLNGDGDFDLPGDSAPPGFQQGKSLHSPHQKTDNTNFSPLEEEKHATGSPRTHLDLNSLSNAWKPQDSAVYQILLLVEPEKVQSLTQIQWHASQQCTIRPDG